MFHWQLHITYTFSVSLKFGACYIMCQWGEFRIKNAIICLYLLIRLFLLFFVIKLVFFSLLLFLTKFKFPQQNIDLSETGIRDQNLSVELYALLDCRIVVIVLDIIKCFILSLLNIKS